MRIEETGSTIRYGIHASPFGDCLVAATDRGICALSFPAEEEKEEVIAGLRKQRPDASIVEDPEQTKELATRVFDRLRRHDAARIAVDVRGTPFQMKVWEALVAIPTGSTASYEEIAARIGHPKAVRAVGNAVANNPVAFLVPCHRVIRKNGKLGDYRWGAERKQAILSWETAGTDSQPTVAR